MKTRNRWLIIAVGFIANVIVGSSYAWSVFASELIAMFGFTGPQTSFAFTLSLGLVPIGMIIAGKLHAIMSVRQTMLLGGIVFGIGFTLAGLTQGDYGNIIMLYITYGTLGGLGIGVVYGSTVPTSVRWFPDKRGMAGGIIAGGFGLGAVVFAPLFSISIGVMGALQTFTAFGVVLGIIVIIASFIVDAPPVGYVPEGWEPPATAPGSVGSVELDTAGMLRTPRFYVLWTMYALACITGLMVISQASLIAQLNAGVTPDIAATAVLFLALSNTGGRFFWGAVSDKIGRYPTLICMYAVTVIGLVILIFATTFPVLVVALMCVGLCFGGFLGVYPSITAENFGSQHLGMNYGIMFTSFTVAAFVGPQLAAAVREATGFYTVAFISSAVVCVLAIVITLILRMSMRGANGA